MISLFASLAVALLVQVEPEEGDQDPMADYQVLVDRFQQGEDEDVVERATLLVGSVPEDVVADVWFMKAVSLRRLELYSEALEALRHAEDSGMGGPLLLVERARNEGTLGRLDEAGDLYDRAREMASSDEDVDQVDMDQARLEGALGRFDDAIGRLERTAASDRALAPSARELQDTYEEQRRPFQYSLGAQFGTDTSILGVAGDQALSSEIGGESAYLSPTLKARLFLWRSYGAAGVTSLSADYRSDSFLYLAAASEDATYTDGELALSFHHPVRRGLTVGVRASRGDGLTRGDGLFRSYYRLGGTMSWEWKRDWALSVIAQATLSEYLLNVPGSQDRDGWDWMVGLRQEVPLGGGWSLRPQLRWMRSETEGRDSDYHAYQGSLELTTPSFEGFRFTASLDYGRYLYSHPNSLSLTGDEREDTRVRASLHVQCDLYELTGWEFARRVEWKPTVGISLSQWDSNIPSFNFNRTQLDLDLLSFGLELKF